MIADTGSTDGTQDLIKEIMADVPGQMVESPWLNFGHNRTKALEAARGMADYVMMIDADETFEVEGDFRVELDGKDSYLGPLIYVPSGFEMLKPMFLRDACNWRYEGVVHNYPKADQTTTQGVVKACRMVAHNDGASWRSDTRAKYLRNADKLKKALAEDPTNARYQFYLGESYRDAGEPAKAIEAYRKRAEMGGWAEEVFWSLYQIAQSEGTTEAYMAAHEARPTRPEPLFALGEMHRARKQYASALIYYETAAKLQESDDILFSDPNILAWKVPDGLSLAQYYTGRFEEALATIDALLESGKLPENEIERILDNRNWSQQNVGSKEARGAEFYDHLFASQDYRSHPVRSKFWEHLKSLIEYKRDVIELGCGTGDLSADSSNYTGYDFSSEGIRQAQEKFPNATFVQADLYQYEWIADPRAMYVICEVLEHLDHDLEVLDAVPVGASVLLSVPSFDDPGHVRFFPELADAVNRYDGLLSGEWHRWRYWHIFTGQRNDVRFTDSAAD